MIVQFQFRLSPPSRFVTDETSNERAGGGGGRLFPRVLVGIPSPLRVFPTRAIHREEKREKRLSRGSKVGDEREATRKGVVVVVSLEAATKGSGNYGEAANSREAEAKAAVGSQADLRRGFAPRFIRAAFLRRQLG